MQKISNFEPKSIGIERKMIKISKQNLLYPPKHIFFFKVLKFALKNWIVFATPEIET